VKIVGRKRTVSDKAVKLVQQWKPLASYAPERKSTLRQFAKSKGWKPLAAIAREVGISRQMAQRIRGGYYFKQKAG
jgi:hypothetical protein